LTGNIARMGILEIAYTILIGEFEWKRPLGRCRSRWEASIAVLL